MACLPCFQFIRSRNAGRARDHIVRDNRCVLAALWQNRRVDRPDHRAIGVHTLLLLVPLCTCACAIAPERVNTDCAWTHDARGAADESHLRTDATVAEDRAIRYADAHAGFRSGHYVDQRNYAAARERCLTAMIDAVAASHGVDAPRVRALLHRRPLPFDLAVVVLPIALLFAAVSDVVTRRIYRRFAPDERAPRIAGLLAASVVLTTIAYLAGTIWSFFAEEEIRLRSQHLSNRAFYLPWSRHPIVAFAVGLAVFWLIALVRTRMVESNFVSARFEPADHEPVSPQRDARHTSLRAGSSIGRAADS